MSGADEIDRLRGVLDRLRTGCRNAVASLDPRGQARMGVACRLTDSQCFCGMHVSEVDNTETKPGSPFDTIARLNRIADAARHVISENRLKLQHGRASRAMINLERAMREAEGET